MSSLKEFAKLLKEAQEQQKETKALDNFAKLLKETQIKEIAIIPQQVEEEVEIFSEQIIEEINSPILETKEIVLEEESSIEKIAKNIKTTNENIETQRWDDPLRKDPKEKFVTFKELNEHYSNFLGRIQQQLSSLGGGGEVNFRYLDDVNRFTMTNSNDNHVLEYDAATGRVQFTNRIGPIDRINFDLNHVHDEERVVGTLCWSSSDQTLNIQHPNGVTQQVGQELYAKVRNRTGSTILNGTVVRFAGAEQNGTSRLLVAPFLGNGAFPSLYGLGITTQDIEDDGDGLVTVWGKIRELNTSAWNIGDILYVSPSNTGQLTNVKPTAPNNVIPFAAVLRKDATQGEIFVRPTIEQQEYYGRFSRTITQTANTVNTGYPIIFDDTEISNGVVIGTPESHIVVSESGFYQFDVSIQAEATSNKGMVHIWFRKNGNDIPKSSRINTVTNGDLFAISSSIQISLNANDWVEVVWAADAAGMQLRGESTPIVGPSVASVLLSVAQIQL